MGNKIGRGTVILTFLALILAIGGVFYHQKYFAVEDNGATELKSGENGVIPYSWRSHVNEELDFIFFTPKEVYIESGVAELSNSPLSLKDSAGLTIFDINVKETQKLDGLGFNNDKNEFLYGEGSYHDLNLKGEANCAKPLYGNENIWALETRFGDAFDVAIKQLIITTAGKSVTFDWWESVLENTEDLMRVQNISEDEAEKIIAENAHRKILRKRILQTLSFQNQETQPIKFTCRKIFSTGPAG